MTEKLKPCPICGLPWKDKQTRHGMVALGVSYKCRNGHVWEGPVQPEAVTGAAGDAPTFSASFLWEKAEWYADNFKAMIEKVGMGNLHHAVRDLCHSVMMDCIKNVGRHEATRSTSAEAALAAEVERLREELSFYAAENNYQIFLPHPDGEHLGFMLPIVYDNGRRAKAALAQQKQEG